MDKVTNNKLNPNKQYAIIHGMEGHEVPKGVNLLVSREGDEVINADTGKIYPIRNKDGYKHVFIQVNDFVKSFMVHRLVATAWQPVGATWFRLIVNHIDGDKSNNHFDNLEWTTKGRNNQHAIYTGLNDISRHMDDFLVYDFDTKERRTARGARHVSAITGLRYELVETMKETPIITTKGKFFIYNPGSVNDDFVNDIKDDEFVDYRKRCDPHSKNVKAVNVNTKEIKFFAKMSDAAKELDVPLSSISQQCLYPGICKDPLNGYLFSEVIDQGAPREQMFKKGELKRRGASNENKRKPIMVLDKDTGVTTRFDWFGEFIKYANRKHSTEYTIKNVQRTIIAQKRKGKKMQWKEFEFSYV